MIRMKVALTGLAGVVIATGFSTPVTVQARDEVTAAPSVATRHFENSADRARTAVMRDQYSDFSFDYPESWGIRSNLSKDNANFVEVWAPGEDGLEDYGFSVGWVSGSGYIPEDKRKFEEFARNNGVDWEKSGYVYRLGSLGTRRIGRYDGFGWQFTVHDPKSGRVIYGRTDLILPPGALRGIAVVSTVAQRTGEVSDPGQIGTTGGMKTIFDSLQFKPDAPNAMRRFVNSPDTARSTILRDQYVDFSFDYPANWAIGFEPEDGTAANFVSVTSASNVNGSPLYVAVGTASGTGNAERDRAGFETFAREKGHSLFTNMTDFRIVSAGPQTVGGVQTVGWRYTATRLARGNGRPVKVFGRADVLFPPGSVRGVLIATYVTDEDKSVSGPERIGDEGALKSLYDSFVVGK